MFLTLFSMLTRMVHLILGISTSQNFPPPLSSADEKKYFLLLQNHDEEARQKLILHNLRLVSHIVRKYYSTAPNAEDLVSIGTLGLVKAVDSFQIDNGAKFATYAAKCIQNEILMHFRSEKKKANEVSLNETIDLDRDGNPLTYLDVICCDEDVTDEIDRKIMTAKMLDCMEAYLTPRERQILYMRYGIGGIKACTQREVACSLRISRSYVSRIEKSALEKLRHALSGT